MSMFCSAVATSLSAEALSKEKKNLQKIGRMGIGEKAVFLSTAMLDRSRYICFTDIRRIFKRVAMSKGGFSGKGIFGSMAYIVVELKDGRTVTCTVPLEADADTLLKAFGRKCPTVPLQSEEAARKLREAEQEEAARYVKTLSPAAEACVQGLEKDKQRLEKEAKKYQRLSDGAQRLRMVQRTKPSYKWVALVVFVFAIIAAGFGVLRFLQGREDGMYIVLIGLAVIFLISASRVLPSASNNLRAVTREYEAAVQDMEKTINGESFPVPARYAHPVVLTRMIRVIREGRTETAEGALQLVKQDLQALNAQVTVSKKEYDEVVEIKPMFLVAAYQ